MRKVFFTLAALVTGAVSVWAQCPTPATATATVTLKRKIAGALEGNFTVDGSGTKVTFSKGNLQYNSDTQAWQFATNQWDYVGGADGVGNRNVTAAGIANNSGIVDLFGWVGTSSNWDDLRKYGITSSTATNATDGYGTGASEALKSDWGTLMGTGWFTLSKDQWSYLFNSRTVNGGTGNGKSYTLGQSVNGVLGVVLYPDDYTGSAYTTGSTWSTFEEAGCVFLPAAGNRNGTSVSNAGSNGYYWSSSPYPSNVNDVYRVYFVSGSVNPAGNGYRSHGRSVRLVRLAE